MGELERRLAELRTQRETLQEELADRSIVAPTIKDIDAVLTSINDAMDNGLLSQRKALTQELVSGISVDSRSAIFPTYRLPAPPVRVTSAVVGLWWWAVVSVTRTKPSRLLAGGSRFANYRPVSQTGVRISRTF